jgi:hypothetical protein
VALTRREFVVLGVAAGTGSLIGCGGASSGSSTDPGTQPNPIVVENAKPGDPSWALTQPATQGEIEGYASAPSINRGEQISFFVNTADPSYTIQIFRMGWYGGAGARSMGPPTMLSGTKQPAPITDPSTLLIDAGNWTNPYVLTIPNNASDPTDWASGVYLAKLTSASGLEAYVVFVVRDDGRSSDLLFQTSVTTYHAYNDWGGSSLYTNPRAFKVSFNRPYIVKKLGPMAAGSGDFQFWEYNLLRFLEREGYDVTYNTDLDTHLSGGELLLHKAFLSVGHDEYWSWQMRQNVIAARDAKVNLGFFGANSCYWQIRFEDSPVTGSANRTIVCYKADALTKDPFAHGPKSYLTTTNWRSFPVNRPEAELVGAMSKGGYYGIAADIVVSDVANFVFQGTGLQNGDHLQGLLGYEADTSYPEFAPVGTVVIAHSPFKASDGFAGFSDMVFYPASSGATVLDTGSMQWSWGVDDYNAALPHAVYTLPDVQQATRNILKQFGASGSQS